jgi:hypothetical protein
MSLHQLLPAQGVDDLMAQWPTEPVVYRRGGCAVDSVITADLLNEYIDSGCYPAPEIAVVKTPHPSITQAAFTEAGRTCGKKLRGLYEAGFTVRLGHAQRVIPVLYQACRGIQQETGYSTYVHAFLTPAGCQGLTHHWDQQLAVVVQIAGVKRWELWRPVVDAPMREFAESWRVWQKEWLPGWEAAGPDMVVDLEPGQTLLLPRGWVHNPAVPPDGGDSVHLTFAVRERTPYWLAEQLLAGALDDPVFRRVLRPSGLLGDGLAGHLDQTRARLVAYLGGLDAELLAPLVREAALRDREYTT